MEFDENLYDEFLDNGDEFLGGRAKPAYLSGRNGDKCASTAENSAR